MAVKASSRVISSSRWGTSTTGDPVVDLHRHTEHVHILESDGMDRFSAT